MKTTNIRRGKHKQAFTLVELIVVIAIVVFIIGFFPCVTTTRSLVNANATRVGNNGRNIVLAIISANMERKLAGLGSVWPSTNACINPQSPNHDYTKDSNSENYFADLAGRVQGVGVSDNFSWHIFSGAGIPAAATAAQFEEGGFNAWNYIAGLDCNTPGDTPFLITANTKIDRLKLEKFSAESATKLTSAEIDALFGTGKPFGDMMAVFIQKDSSMRQMKKKYLKNPKLFTNSSRFNAENNPNAKVIGAAKGALNSGN